MSDYRAPNAQRGMDGVVELEREVSRRFKNGVVDKELVSLTDQLVERVGAESLDDRFSLKCRSLVCEVRDWIGRTKDAQSVVERGEEVWSRIVASPPPREDQALRLARERARFVADYARVFCYRERNYEEAERILKDCREFVTRHVEAPVFPCYGTRAQISYFLGCAYRQLGDLARAEEEYGRALELHRLRAEAAVKNHGLTSERGQEEIAFARHRTAVIVGLGVGWVNYTRGYLGDALHSNITPTQTALIECNDPVTSAYLSLIRGAILRSLAGSTDDAKLAEARAAAEYAYAVFTGADYRHDAYATRAAREVALSWLYSRDSEKFSKAQDFIEAMERLAGKDQTWQANALIVRSRLHRLKGEGREALKAAENAVRLTAHQEEPLGGIDALIARGEALQELGQLVDAERDFRQALRLVQESGGRAPANPKLEGVLAIHLARTCVRTGDERRALDWLQEWERVGHSVEHRSIHERAADVKEELSKLRRDFVVPVNESDLAYEKHEADLRKWLIERAKAKGPRQDDVAKALKVSRGTLGNWERELGLNRARVIPDRTRRKR